MKTSNYGCYCYAVGCPKNHGHHCYSTSEDYCPERYEALERDVGWSEESQRAASQMALDFLMGMGW